MTDNRQTRIEDKAFDYISEWEGFSPDGRPDEAGIPSLGHGFALILIDRGTYSVRKGLIDELTSLGIYLDKDHIKDLTRIAKTFTDGDPKGAKDLAKQFRILPITRDQAKALFHHIIPGFIGAVKDGIGENAYNKLSPERLMPLIDQAYRRPAAFRRVAKAVGQAIMTDDFGGAAKALLRMGRGRRTSQNAMVLREPVNPNRIRVKRGEVLGAIVQRESAKRGYRITKDEVVKLNRLDGPGEIAEGQFLVMPDPPAAAGDRDPNWPPRPKDKPDRATERPPSPKDKPDRTTKPDKRGELEPAPTEESPEIERLRTAMRQLVERVDHTLLKPTLDLTRAEIDDVMGHDEYWPRDGHDRAEAFQNKTRDYFETFHERDSKVTPPETERPLTAFGGGDLVQARERIADALAPAAERDGREPTVKGLQETLNDRRYGSAARVLPNLVVDGDLGPRTLARIDEELVRDGDGALADALRRRLA